MVDDVAPDSETGVRGGKSSREREVVTRERDRMPQSGSFRVFQVRETGGRRADWRHIASRSKVQILARWVRA